MVVDMTTVVGFIGDCMVLRGYKEGGIILEENDATPVDTNRCNSNNSINCANTGRR